MEKRFDVKVPLANTELLQQLASESEKTGIVESRLLVQYATRYVQMTNSGALVPVVVSSGGGDTSRDRAHTNGHVEAKEAEVSLPSPSLDSDALDTLFGDPD